MRLVVLAADVGAESVLLRLAKAKVCQQPKVMRLHLFRKHPVRPSFVRPRSPGQRRCSQLLFFGAWVLGKESTEEPAGVLLGVRILSKNETHSGVWFSRGTVGKHRVPIDASFGPGILFEREERNGALFGRGILGTHKGRSISFVRPRDPGHAQRTPWCVVRPRCLSDHEAPTHSLFG